MEICNTTGNWTRSLKSQLMSTAGYYPCSHCDSQKVAHLSSPDLLFLLTLYTAQGTHSICVHLGLDMLIYLCCPSASTGLTPVGVWIWGLGALQLAGHSWVRRDMRTAMFSKNKIFLGVRVFLCVWISLISLNIQKAKGSCFQNRLRYP